MRSDKESIWGKGGGEVGGPKINASANQNDNVIHQLNPRA